MLKFLSSEDKEKILKKLLEEEEQEERKEDSPPENLDQTYTNANLLQEVPEEETEEISPLERSAGETYVSEEEIQRQIEGEEKDSLESTVAQFAQSATDAGSHAEQKNYFGGSQEQQNLAYGVGGASPTEVYEEQQKEREAVHDKEEKDEYIRRNLL
tara:strand:- start:227 stop:697 length:471 start_codon:yes stop_codon:yes gene_type:complete